MNISKGRLKAMTRFDTMHMDTSAFSSDEDCQKGGVLLFLGNHRGDYNYYSQLLFLHF